MQQSSEVACYGCGTLVLDVDGPTHRYIGASAGCWALYGEVLARGAGDPRFGDPGMLISNSYAVQHPGSPGPQAIQSVAVHLIGLYAILGLGYHGRRMVDVLRRAADGSHHFRWLEPPTTHYPVTIRSVYAAVEPDAHHAAAHAMAETTWATWQKYHAQIAAWAVAVGVE